MPIKKRKGNGQIHHICIKTGQMGMNCGVKASSVGLIAFHMQIVYYVFNNKNRGTQ